MDDPKNYQVFDSPDNRSGDDTTSKSKNAFPVMKRSRKNAGGNSPEAIDLDVAPVMNLFVILLPFLLSMAVFTNMAILEFSLPPAAAITSSDQQTPQEMKDLDISVIITPDGFRIVGTGKKLELVPKVRGQYQFESLRALLKAIKFEYPSQKSVVLVLDSEVLYDDLVKFMDICRESQFPDIGLSGEIG